MTITILASIGIFILTQFTKKYITPKYGDTGLHIFIFIVALAVFGVQSAMTYYPGFAALVIKAGEYLIGSVALYQVIIKQLKNNTNLI